MGENLENLEVSSLQYKPQKKKSLVFSVISHKTTNPKREKRTEIIESRRRWRKAIFLLQWRFDIFLKERTRFQLMIYRHRFQFFSTKFQQFFFFFSFLEILGACGQCARQGRLGTNDTNLWNFVITLFCTFWCVQRFYLTPKISGWWYGCFWSQLHYIRFSNFFFIIFIDTVITYIWFARGKLDKNWFSFS